MERGELSDTQWKKLKPFLPPEKPKVGRPNKSHRLVINAILWHLRTGAPWRDMPKRYGAWETIYSRYRKWTRDGTWQRVFDRLNASAEQDGEINWTMHFVDGTIVRAHQHSAGAPKKGGKTRPSAKVAVG